ncbi:MAG: FtsX-like permease family protein, partial [Anaerolineae bacterium]|nr:FtsX-like permease family protein [Anaerolineae bacterium]
TEEVRNAQPITIGDAEAIADPFQAPSVAAVATTLEDSAEVTGGGEQTTTSIVGATPAYAAVRNYATVEGEFITTEQDLGRASVAVLGPDVADKLFGRSDGLVGETVRIEGQPFRIIGILESKGGGSFGSQDNIVMVPFNTAKERLIRRPRNQVDMIYVQAVSAEAVTQASDEIAQVLRNRHRTELGVDDFTIFSQQDFVETASTITGVFTTFLGGVAAISLLVGGIGIMNIMLVSVTERTREIGLRKAIGARKRDILTQFLTESSLLSFIGGVVGIIFGWVIAFIVGQIAAAANTPFQPAIGIDAILLATVFSTAVGLFFGIYPANRAANLQPVEALRYE